MHPVINRLWLAAPLAFALLAPAPAPAQLVGAFTTWGPSLGKTVHQCPTSAPAVPPAPPFPTDNSNPYFPFNGTTTVSGFACQQVGWFNLSGGHWFMQNIQSLLPPACKNPQPSCRVNTVRVCNWAMVGHANNPPGPFGGPVGPGGCEKLWTEEYPSPQ